MKLREPQLAEASYDNPTGLVTLTAIKAGFNKDGRGTEWPRSLRHVNFSDSGTRRQLEVERAGRAS